MKFLFLSFLILFFSTKVAISQNIEKAYFAGGCFWCMEESFEKLKGVEEVISGYSGGKSKILPPEISPMIFKCDYLSQYVVVKSFPLSINI